MSWNTLHISLLSKSHSWSRAFELVLTIEHQRGFMMQVQCLELDSLYCKRVYIPLLSKSQPVLSLP